MCLHVGLCAQLCREDLGKGERKNHLVLDIEKTSSLVRGHLRSEQDMQALYLFDITQQCALAY